MNDVFIRRADIQDQVAVGYVFLFKKLVSHRRDAPDHRGPQAFGGILLVNHLHRAAKIQSRPDAARGLQAKHSVVADLGHPETDLIHMAHQKDAVFTLRVQGAYRVPGSVCELAVGKTLSVFQCKGLARLLTAGYRRCHKQLIQKFEVHVHLPPF